MRYDLLIQIINYNTKQHLGVCLKSLFEDLNGWDINYKVIVLDNNSGDDLEEYERTYEDKIISFNYHKKNLGFGGGHNFISSLEDSRHILILNSDIKFIEKDSVKRLYDGLLKSEKYKVTGPRLLLEDMTPQEFDHGEIRGFASWIKNSYGSSYWKQRSKPAEAAWVSGAVFMIETDLFRKMNGFDEKFFLYKEEEELCKRIRESGEKILYDPEVSVMHYGHVVAQRSRHFSDSMNYYLDKHYRKNISYKILHAIKTAKDIAIYGKVRERS